MKKYTLELEAQKLDIIMAALVRAHDDVGKLIIEIQAQTQPQMVKQTKSDDTVQPISA